MRLKELREKLAKAVADMRAMASKIEKETRDFTAEERSAWDKVNAEVDSLQNQIGVLERAANLGQYVSQPEDNSNPGRQYVAPQTTEARASQNASDYAAALRGWLQVGSKLQPSDEQIAAAKRVGVDLAANDIGINIGNRRAIGDAPQTVTTTGGGYTVPVTLASALESAMLYFNPLEGVANVITTASGEDINFPTVNDTSAAGEMVAINTEVSEGAITFGQVTLKAYKGSSKDVVVPFELIQDSAFNIEAFVGSALGERLGRLEAAQTTTGAGATSSAPTGCVTIATAGVTTASATAITADELIDLAHSVDPSYRQSAMRPAYMMNDATLKLVRKLKDGNGQYLWQPGIQAGIPQSLYGFPLVVNPAMAAPTATNVAVLFGAWSKFLVRKVGQVRIVRDPYKFSTKDQTLYVAFMRFDSNLLDAGTHPLKKLTMHA